MDGARLHLAALLAVFILTGVAIPLLIEVITLNGGCEKTTLMIMLPGSLGMICSSLTHRHTFHQGLIKWKYVVLISLLELLAQSLSIDGLMLAGSAIYTVACSSVTIYTALLALVFLNRRLHSMQWLGVVVVFIGLAAVSAGAKAEGSDVALGVLFILTGSICHACVYVLSEFLLMWSDDPVSPHYLCFVLGCLGTTLNLVWQCVYTYPRYQSLVVDQVALYHGDVGTIALSYAGLALMAGVHAVAFYQLLGCIGSVSTGICKAVQSVAVFVGSHFAFCSVQRSQCFTLAKAASLATVSVGVVLYSSFKAAPPRAGAMMILHDDSRSPDDEEGRRFLLQHVISPDTRQLQRPRVGSEGTVVYYQLADDAL